MNRAGVNVQETVLEQLAASEAVLTADEKELGVALVDIGGGTTDIAIFERGSLWHTAVVPIGGDHFTNDIAVGLRMPIPEAEKLKRKCGCALSAMVGDDETMEVASVGGRPPRMMARRILSEVLQPRAEEIFHLVWDEIHRAGLREVAQLRHRADRRRREPRRACRRSPSRSSTCPCGAARPAGVGGLADHVNNPSFATAVGPAAVRAPRIAGTETARVVGPAASARLTERVQGRVQGILLDVDDSETWRPLMPNPNDRPAHRPATRPSRDAVAADDRRRRRTPAPASR